MTRTSEIPKGTQDARRQEKFKKLEAEHLAFRRERIKLEKVKSGKNKGKNKCTTRKGVEDQHPVVGPRLAGALVPLLKDGERTRE